MAVPTHFFKIIVAENENGKLVMENYVLPNAVISDSTPLTSFMVSTYLLKCSYIINLLIMFQ